MIDKDDIQKDLDELQNSFKSFFQKNQTENLKPFKHTPNKPALFFSKSRAQSKIRNKKLESFKVYNDGSSLMAEQMEEASSGSDAKRKRYIKNQSMMVGYSLKNAMGYSGSNLNIVVQ